MVNLNNNPTNGSSTGDASNYATKTELQTVQDKVNTLPGTKTDAGGERFNSDTNEALGLNSTARGNGTVAGWRGFSNIIVDGITADAGTAEIPSVSGLNVGDPYIIFENDGVPQNGPCTTTCGYITDIDKTNNLISITNCGQGISPRFIMFPSHPRIGDTIFDNTAYSISYSDIGLNSSQYSEGTSTYAVGEDTHSQGKGTIAMMPQQDVAGRYNIIDDYAKYAHITGNGTADDKRSNAHTLAWDGTAWYANKVKVGGTSQDDADAKELATLDDIGTVAAKEISLALKPFYMDETYEQYEGQITSVTVGANTTKAGFAKDYNADQLIGVSRVDIYVPLRDDMSTTVTLFLKKKSPWGVTINTTTVAADKAGFYTLLIDGSVEVPTTDTISAGFYVNTANALNNVTVYTNSMTSNKYIANTTTYSKTLTGDWTTSTNNNSIICVFYKSTASFPKAEIQKAIKDTSVELDKTLRVIAASDLHFDSVTAGLTMGLQNDRFETMVQSMNAEHHKKPIDFCIFNGDLITIHSGNLKKKKERMLYFKQNYLDRLEMPWFAIRGNHDGFTDEEWEEMFNQKPQISIETDSFVFLLIDVYNTYSASFNSGADMQYIGAYTQLNWIKEQVEYAKAASKKVICVYHYIDFSKMNSDNTAILEKDWLNYIKNEDTIIAQVVGHSHVVYAQNDSTTGKPKIGTGNFGNTSGQASDTSHPKANRSGYKIIEVKPDKLAAYHIYPALTYPSWDGEEYVSEATQTSDYTICSLTKNGGADYNLSKINRSAMPGNSVTNNINGASVYFLYNVSGITSTQFHTLLDIPNFQPSLHYIVNYVQPVSRTSMYLPLTDLGTEYEIDLASNAGATLTLKLQSDGKLVGKAGSYYSSSSAEVNLRVFVTDDTHFITELS